MNFTKRHLKAVLPIQNFLTRTLIDLRGIVQGDPYSILPIRYGNLGI